jgi:hypothetical protein
MMRFSQYQPRTRDQRKHQQWSVAVANGYQDGEVIPMFSSFSVRATSQNLHHFAFEIVCDYSTIPTNEIFKLGFDPFLVRPRHEGIAEATKDTSAVSCALWRLRPFDHLHQSVERALRLSRGWCARCEGGYRRTRLFDRHLHASPAKVARTARVQRAKRLIGETSLVVVGIPVGERQTPHTIGMRRCEDLRYTAAAIVADQVDLIDLERGEGLAQHIGVSGDGHVLDLGVAMSSKSTAMHRRPLDNPVNWRRQTCLFRTTRWTNSATGPELASV